MGHPPFPLTHILKRQHIGTSQICQGTDFGVMPLVGRKKRNVDAGILSPLLTP